MLRQQPRNYHLKHEYRAAVGNELSVQGRKLNIFLLIPLGTSSETQNFHWEV